MVGRGSSFGWLWGAARPLFVKGSMFGLQGVGSEVV